MELLDFLKNYWVLITSLLVPFLLFVFAMIEGIKCTLRNDILAIYDRCKENKKISKYQLEAIMHSFKIYKMLRGNSFVENIVERVKLYEIID